LGICSGSLLWQFSERCDLSTTGWHVVGQTKVALSAMQNATCCSRQRTGVWLADAARQVSVL
jgi:hypothetical protein